MGTRSHRPSRAVALLGILLGLATAAPSPAAATVRFGNNVFIGGHDFSNQTYDRRHRAVIHLYGRTPPRQGCAWYPDGRGGHVKICHLRRIR